MKEDVRWYYLASELNQRHSCEINELLEKKGIENLILKGPAVSRYYPDDEPRPSVDIDLAVAPKDFDSVQSLIRSEEFPTANIDLHKGVENFSVRSWEDLYSRSRLIERETGSYRVLGHEDQLRLVINHWLFDGGERKERLADIKYILEADESIDWNYLLNTEGEIRRGWILAGLHIAARSGKARLSSVPSEVRGFEVPNWIYDTLAKRWRDEVSFRPIDQELGSPKSFLLQLSRRFPPNALMAMTALERDFEKDSVWRAQWSYFFRRMIPSIKRTLSNSILKRNHAR